MTNTATPIFDFLASHQSCSIQRHEIACPRFGRLRRNLGAIIGKLKESGEPDGNEIADQLRALLLSWLTGPVPFDNTTLDAVRLLGEPAQVGVRWGQDLRSNYEAALQAARELSQHENPLRDKLSSVIRDLRTHNRSFKIYCHKRARPHFDSLLRTQAEAPLGDTAFLHSVRDYREADLFDDLIKVGPLRSRGWGAAPDALVTAPRFSNLIQFVWLGCGDEPGFGYDPVSPPTESTTQPRTGDPATGHVATGPIRWVSQISRTGEDPQADLANQVEDEFGLLAAPNHPGEKRSAVLVQLDDEQGILFPPQSKVLSFDPDPTLTNQLGRRIPGALLAGMFVIRPLLRDVDLGGLQAEHGHYSCIWKERLIEERHKGAGDLVTRLLKEGLHLAYLYPAIAHWCELPTTVIHAPQRRQHFEILIRILGIDFPKTDDPRRANAPWWQYAWNEIRRSRGEAIAAGFQEQDIVEEQLLATLETMLPEIQRLAATSEGFLIQLPPDQSLQGAALFNKVTFVEDGFVAPQTELKIVRDLNTLDQWRV